MRTSFGCCSICLWEIHACVGRRVAGRRKRCGVAPHLQNCAKFPFAGRRGRRPAPYRSIQAFPSGEGGALAPDEGMQAAGTAQCDAFALYSPSSVANAQDVFPIGKPPRDALRLVQLSPKGRRNAETTSPQRRGNPAEHL